MESEKKMNKQIKSRIRPINTENKLRVARGEGGKMSEGEWEAHVSRYGLSKSWEQKLQKHGECNER